MTDPQPTGQGFGMSGDAKQQHLADIRRMTATRAHQRPSRLAWLVAACLAVLAVAAVAVAWRWASTPTTPEQFTVRCQFAGSSLVIETTALADSQAAVKACREARPPRDEFLPAAGLLPMTCLDGTARVVLLDGTERCPAGSTPD